MGRPWGEGGRPQTLLAESVNDWIRNLYSIDYRVALLRRLGKFKSVCSLAVSIILYQWSLTVSLPQSFLHQSSLFAMHFVSLSFTYLYM